ncbi:hypothetical protein GQ600_4237 [Phytophthora cactorum]|nr:hypothetical protein GQ600_4237 [Phytophthora cactorum]
MSHPMTREQSHEHRTLRRWVLLVDGGSHENHGGVGHIWTIRCCNRIPRRVRQDAHESPQFKPIPPAHQLANLTFSEKVGKALQDATDQTTVSRVTSATVQLASLLPGKTVWLENALYVRPCLFASILKNLPAWYLALETLLLYQMLEAGSPTPLIAIFTVVVATNALACAAMMFVPHERAPLAETLIDLYLRPCKVCNQSGGFPHWLVRTRSSMIADAEQTAVIYESLKSLRILTPLNIFTRIGVNMTLCFRLWQLVDLLRDTKTQNSSVYPKRHRFGAAFLIVFAIMLLFCGRKHANVFSSMPATPRVRRERAPMDDCGEWISDAVPVHNAD